MISRRLFLQTSAAAMWEPFNFRTGQVLAAPDAQLDTSELPGFDALRWYAQQATVLNPDDLEFKVLERESLESGSFPFKVNGSYVYLTGELALHVGRPDFGHEFVMAYTDSNGAKRSVNDVWMKGHLGGDADRVAFTREIDGNTEENSYGQGGYSILRYRPRRSDDGYGEHIFSKFGIEGTIYSEKVLEDIAYFDTSRAPLLTGPYEGRHKEFLARGVQLLIESNAEYRKNLQHIIRELEKEGKIKI